LIKTNHSHGGIHAKLQAHVTYKPVLDGYQKRKLITDHSHGSPETLDSYKLTETIGCNM
jgi:hypothetical protein